MPETLETALAQAYACLAEGAADADSVWHVPTLANIDAAGQASQRSVVLRGWHAAQRCLEVHTDTRSAKYADLRRDPRASLHGWDPSRHIQLRVRGRVALHAGDGVAQAAWAALRPATRGTYRVLPGPGTTIAAPSETAQAGEDDAKNMFCVIRLAIEELEWLRLEQGSYARARFRWDKGVIDSMWLVP